MTPRSGQPKVNNLSSRVTSRNAHNHHRSMGDELPKSNCRGLLKLNLDLSKVMSE